MEKNKKNGRTLATAKALAELSEVILGIGDEISLHSLEMSKDEQGLKASLKLFGMSIQLTWHKQFVGGHAWHVKFAGEMGVSREDKELNTAMAKALTQLATCSGRAVLALGGREEETAPCGPPPVPEGDASSQSKKVYLQRYFGGFRVDGSDGPAPIRLSDNIPPFRVYVQDKNGKHTSYAGATLSVLSAFDLLNYYSPGYTYVEWENPDVLWLHATDTVIWKPRRMPGPETDEATVTLVLTAEIRTPGYASKLCLLKWKRPEGTVWCYEIAEGGKWRGPLVNSHQHTYDTLQRAIDAGWYTWTCDLPAKLTTSRYWLSQEPHRPRYRSRADGVE